MSTSTQQAKSAAAAGNSAWHNGASARQVAET